ncbi:MAG: His/Gly/Thr/Pro-type tRNA ligase C-terminal domain-containing protein, partial [Candidatus Limnocylindrales bacterium]
IFRKEEERAGVAAAIDAIEPTLRDVVTPSGPLRYTVDWREESPGFKYNHWELRGVPLRLEIGPRDVAAGQAVLVRRLDRVKESLPLSSLGEQLPLRLAAYQAELFQRALDFRAENTHHVDDYEEFKRVLEEKGGFLMAPWCGDAGCEKQINAETGATTRVVPFDSPDEAGPCLVDGRPSERRVLFARAY